MRFTVTPVRRGSGKLAPAAAVAVLRRTDNPAVMAGDAGLLHSIAEEMGWPHDCWLTEKRVLDALSRHNQRELVEGRVLGGGGRKLRIFWLPEHAPQNKIPS